MNSGCYPAAAGWGFKLQVRHPTDPSRGATESHSVRNGFFVYRERAMYFTYVLYSPQHDRVYVGQTGDLKQRIAKHNDGFVRSTIAYRPWRLIHYEVFTARADAMKREKELKTHKGRDYIRELISIGRVRQPPD